MALILFVDDDVDTLASLSRAAEVLGHRAITTETGSAALELAGEHLPDIIFVDMRLADMDGMQVICRMQQDERLARIPMYILSASPAADMGECAQSAGALGFLNKPIRLQTLQEIIQQHITERS